MHCAVGFSCAKFGSKITFQRRGFVQFSIPRIKAFKTNFLISSPFSGKCGDANSVFWRLKRSFGSSLIQFWTLSCRRFCLEIGWAETLFGEKFLLLLPLAADKWCWSSSVKWNISCTILASGNILNTPSFLTSSQTYELFSQHKFQTKFILNVKFTL